MGPFNAPVWYDDKFVVGMQDKDDGHVVTASKIIMMSLDGKAKKEISATDEIAMYPYHSGKRSRNSLQYFGWKKLKLQQFKLKFSLLNMKYKITILLSFLLSFGLNAQKTRDRDKNMCKSRTWRLRQR